MERQPNQSRRGLLKTPGGVVSTSVVLVGASPASAEAAVGFGTIVKIWKMGDAIDVDDAPNGADSFTMGGDVEVKSSSGEVNIKTMGGEVKVLFAAGPVHATTMSGAIFVRIRQSSWGDIQLSSNAGDITLIVPKSYPLEADISLAYTKDQTDKFAITADFPLQQSASSEWDDRRGTPRKYIHATGKLGSGKANRHSIETINGNVVLKQA